MVSWLVVIVVVMLILLFMVRLLLIWMLFGMVCYVLRFLLPASHLDVVRYGFECEAADGRASHRDSARWTPEHKQITHTHTHTIIHDTTSLGMFHTSPQIITHTKHTH